MQAEQWKTVWTGVANKMKSIKIKQSINVTGSALPPIKTPSSLLVSLTTGVISSNVSILLHWIAISRLRQA